MTLQGIRSAAMAPWLTCLQKYALEKSSFQVVIAPLAPTLPPLGAGAHCDASALPELEISP